MNDSDKILPIYPSVEQYLTLFVKEFCYPQKKLIEDWKVWLNKRNSSEGSAKDFIWSEFNKFLLQIAKNASNEIEMYNYQRMLYGYMIKFLRETSARQSVIDSTRRCFNLMDLNLARLSQFEVGMFIITTKDCNESRQFEGKVYLLNDMVKDQPLPYSNCKRNGGCICMYGTEAIRDKNGRLTMK